MVVQRGLIDRGTFPNPRSGTGSYFQDGLRTGPTWVKNNALLPTTASGQAVPQFTRWGGGVLDAPIVSYPIRPAPLILAGTQSDVASIPAGTTTGDVPLTVVPGSTQNRSTTWFATCAGGEYGLQLDWPRAIQITLGAGIIAPIKIHVFGYDWWGNPMQMAVDNMTTANGAIYSPIERVADVGSSNKAFYQITRVRLTGNVPGGAANVLVTTCPCFGLPYLYTGDLCAPLAIMWQGVSELGVAVLGTGPLQPITGAQLSPGERILPSANSTSDVRGTYVPSTDPVANATNSLIFIYYVGGADVGIDQWADAGLPAWSSTQETLSAPSAVTPLTEQDLMGQPQYFTGLPA